MFHKRGNREVITIKVDGMTCSHCENRVKSAIESLKGIKEVFVGSESKIVRIVSNGKVSMTDIIRVIKEAGYEVIL